MTTLVAPSHDHTSAAIKHDVRKDIQAFRAVAVMAVVVYHVWPGALPGGFVGVDVFFVDLWLPHHQPARGPAAVPSGRLRALLGPTGAAPDPGRRPRDPRDPGRRAALHVGVPVGPGGRRRHELDAVRRELAADRGRHRLPRPAPGAVTFPALLVALGRGAVLPAVAAGHRAARLVHAQEQPADAHPGVRHRLRGARAHLTGPLAGPDLERPGARLLRDVHAAVAARYRQPPRGGLPGAGPAARSGFPHGALVGGAARPRRSARRDRRPDRLPGCGGAAAHPRDRGAHRRERPGSSAQPAAAAPRARGATHRRHVLLHLPVALAADHPGAVRPGSRPWSRGKARAGRADARPRDGQHLPGGEPAAQPPGAAQQDQAVVPAGAGPHRAGRGVLVRAEVARGCRGPREQEGGPGRGLERRPVPRGRRF